MADDSVDRAISCHTPGVPRPGRKSGRVTPKGAGPQDRHLHDHREVEAPRPEVAPIRGANALLASEEDQGLFEADDWASAIQVLFRPSGPAQKAFAKPATVLDSARADGGAGGALLATALAVYGPAEIQAEARALADELAQGRTDLPAWLAHMGAVTPGRCLRVTDIWDDSYSLLLDYECDGSTRGAGVQIDMIGGGLAGGFLHGPTTAEMKEIAATDQHAVVTEIGGADARALLEAAVLNLDSTFDPGPEDDPGDEEDRAARALVEHRFAQLPTGGQASLGASLSAHDRDSVIAAFLQRPGAALLAEGADIADTICTFSTYCDGEPLRWSPARVETFLAGWIPHEIIAEDNWYRNVPPVLREWLRYSADATDLRADGLEISLQMVDSAMGFMQERGDEPPIDPGVNITQQMIDAGIDQTNFAEVQAWVDEYNTRTRGTES